MAQKSSGLARNILWKLAERLSAQAVTLIVSVILARLLEPQHYGVIAIVMIFISIANVFVTEGFGSALIQKKNADALDFSSVLYFNIFFSLVLYCVLFFSAPFIAKFFGEGYEILTPVLRVLGLRLILTALNSIQHAYVSKKMIFKKYFVATLTGTVISAIVGISMAYLGYGVWALVGQYLTNTTVDTVVLFLTLRRKPLLKFSIKRLKGLFKFGSRILGIALFIEFYKEIRSILIGKLYSSQDLAFYKKGAQFPDLFITNINTSIGAVLFPGFVKVQDNRAELKSIAKKSIKLSFFIVCPLLLGLLAISDTFVTVVLTDKWRECIPYVNLFCINALFYTIHSTNMQVVKAVGRSDISLKLEIIKKVIEFVGLIITIQFGPIWIATAMAITSTLFTYINAIPSKKLIGYSFSEQVKDIYSTLLIGIAMVIVVRIVGNLNMNEIGLLAIQVITGCITYLGLSFLFRKKEISEIINILKNQIGKMEG